MNHAPPMPQVQIKICGITSADDAQLAMDAGAHWLGLILAPQSPRAVTLAQAQAITTALAAQPPSPAWVGVFQNADRATIQQALDTLPLAAIQLHGQEPPELVSGWPVPVIKALSVPLEGLSRQALSAYTRLGAHVLLDAPKGLNPEQKTKWLNEWIHPLAPAALPPGTWLAGGLNPENIETLLGHIRPACVDVASGVESAPGIKDPHKVHAFCQAVRRAAANPLPEAGTVLS
jgi:phosphoribosylanthranilate isomerase